MLPARTKVRAVEPIARWPYAQISDFMADLSAREGIAAMALRFVVLNAPRSNECVAS